MQKTTFFSLIVITFIIACVKVPITNRKQMKLLPESMLQNMSLTEYKKVITAGPLSKNTTDVNRIKNIGSKVSVAIATYLKSHNGQSRLDGVNWEFNLIESNLENAWCMPGGKVAFYSGLLPLCKDDNGIAVVMGARNCTCYSKTRKRKNEPTNVASNRADNFSPCHAKQTSRNTKTFYDCLWYWYRGRLSTSIF